MMARTLLPSLLLATLGQVMSASVTDTCLHLHTEKLIQPRAGEDILLLCQFQYKPNFTLDEVHILWGKELAQDEYRALIIFDGRNVKHFYKNALFSTDSLQEGKASILLKNVMAAESGTYLCDVTVNAANSKGRTEMQVMRAAHVCDEDLELQKVHEVKGSNSDYGFPNRSIGAILAVAILLAVALSTVVYVQCKKRAPAQGVPA